MAPALRLPANEEGRLRELATYDVYDEPPHADFDNLAEVAARALRVPIGYVNVLGRDEQRFKGRYGTAWTGFPRDGYSLCSRAILSDEVLVLEDVARDPEFADAPWVKDGSIRFYAGAPIIDAQGFALGTVCAVSPHPHRAGEEDRRMLRGLAKQALALLELRRMRSLARLRERFIGVVSHDLRNPLQAFAVGTSLLLARGNLDETGQRAVKRLSSSAQRMERLVRDLVDFTRARVGSGLRLRPQLCDLGSLAQRCAQELELAVPERKIATELRPGVTGHWDPDRICQAMSNLCGNALRYSPDDSVVTVRVFEEGADRVFSVHNFGPGVPRELLGYIFDPFRSGLEAERRGDGHSASLGLGLYIVREIVGSHGGTVSVTSDPDEGTVFTMRLPARAPLGDADALH